MINRVSRVVHNVSEALNPSPPPPSRNAPTEEKPVPVEIRKAPFAPMEMIQKVLGSVLNILVTTAIVIVFVIFMLVQREDLRDRIIRLGGAGRVNVTTQALDDAAHRLGQYLLVQLVINVGFGLLAGVGLYFMHVPNPVLWALLAALLRYVPYLGIWIAAALPAMMAFAVEPGWVKVPAVFGLYFGIDLLMYNFVEPLLIRQFDRNITGGDFGSCGFLDLALGTRWAAIGDAADRLRGGAGEVRAEAGIFECTPE